MGTLWLGGLVVMVFMVAAVWKVFEKAGHPGWACLIPIYNLYVTLKIAGKPGWWLILYFVPLVNLIVTGVVSLGVAEKFGKGAGFGFGLWILAFIFYPILGFGDARYKTT